jgi:hypothetical protein
VNRSAPGDAHVEGRHREGGQLGAQRVHPDDLGGDVHVPDRHPLPPSDPRVRLRATQASTKTKHEAEQVLHPGFRVRPGHGLPEQEPLRRVDLARGRVVVEPRHLVEQPHEEELRRQRRHGQVEALDAQGRQAEHHAHHRRHDARQERDRHHVHPGKRRHQLVGRVGPHRHEPARAQARPARNTPSGCSARSPRWHRSGTAAGSRWPSSR